MHIEALVITYTILRGTYYTYSIMGPKALFELLRPLYYKDVLTDRWPPRLNHPFIQQFLWSSGTRGGRHT